ncbi:hypothetical protein M8J76_015769 [Diaphorina citri]|nr:hypothetical protein M8J76_015769 [Diaphorina citri]
MLDKVLRTLMTSIFRPNNDRTVLLVFMTSFSVESFLTDFLLLFPDSAFSLRLLSMRVDTHVINGNSTTLECLYDLESEALYSVKWYKDGNEFYRYIPNDLPQTQVYPLPGVHVDRRHSNSSHISLVNISLSSSGRYRCEVSAEGPSFQTVTDHGDMVAVGE